KFECHFINGTERVRNAHKVIYNPELYVMFDSDVGHYVGFTPCGEKQAWNWNSNPVFTERKRAEVDTFCRHNYEGITAFSLER
ncbi:HB2Q protein, partial [Erpornis zantholeuca]|nr:HB2Q protein [Erpornis zantholeuca]